MAALSSLMPKSCSICLNRKGKWIINMNIRTKCSELTQNLESSVTHLGISPRYLQELQRARIQPKTAVDLSRLEIVSSTGMVLPESLFEWFYDEGFPSKVRLNNMSGGTDIMGCFAIGNAMTPVYVGGSPERGLGIKVEVYDSTIEGSYVKGQAVEDGAPGELVATAGFPNQPVTFWGQDGPDRYQKAYFARFDSLSPSYPASSFPRYSDWLTLCL